MRGTMIPVNRAMIRPLLIGGVEKSLLFLNGALCFPLMAVTHLALSACLVSALVFMILHVLFRWIILIPTDIFTNIFSC